MQATIYTALVDLLWTIRRRSAAEGQIDRTQLHILALVTRQPGLRSSEVSRVFGLDLSTVSRHVSELVHKGLAERTEDPEDRRAQRLMPTTAGQAMVDEIARYQEQLLGSVLRTWTPQDQAELARLLTRLNADMNVQPDTAPVG